MTDDDGWWFVRALGSGAGLCGERYAPLSGTHHDVQEPNLAAFSGYYLKLDILVSALKALPRRLGRCRSRRSGSMTRPSARHTSQRGQGEPTSTSYRSTGWAFCPAYAVKPKTGLSRSGPSRWTLTRAVILL